MKYDAITFEINDGLAVITLNRPDVMNAMNGQMRAEVLHATKRAVAEARVLVMTGAGKAFCSGQDLGDARKADQLDLERTLRDEYEPMIEALTSAPIPVIAAVNGAAAGAGANLALAADVVIAAKSALFLQAFTRIGLLPDAGGTFWLPRQIGMARAMGAALFAEPVTAEQAVQWGMIWEAIEDENFAAHWKARARKLADGPTFAYGQVKKALHASAANDLSEQLTLEAALQGECGKTRDFQEGIMAFLEKRPAQFEGR